MTKNVREGGTRVSTAEDAAPPYPLDTSLSGSVSLCYQSPVTHWHAESILRHS